MPETKKPELIQERTVTNRKARYLKHRGDIIWLNT